MWWCRESNGGAGFLSKIQIRDDLQETGKKKHKHKTLFSSSKLIMH